MNQEGQILDSVTIEWKIKRMAAEILELHTQETELLMLGVQDGGWILAHNLAEVIASMSSLKVELAPIHLNKKNPLQEPILLNVEVDNKAVVLVDDVANSGRTLLYALKPLLDHHPKSVHLAVLIDRSHKKFPIIPDIIGYRLSTTLQEKVLVQTQGNTIVGATLS